MQPLDLSDLWDQWCSARVTDPSLRPEEFLATRATVEGEVLAELLVLLDVEAESEPQPLIDILARRVPGEDGLVFAGHRLGRCLGQGSSGMVFLAEPLAEPGVRVALKILNPLLGAPRLRRELLLREARIAGSLDHQGIVQVQGSGIERGYAWVSTEWVEGRTLSSCVADPLGPREREVRAIELVLQLCDALQFAHAKGVIHRDLKPENLVLDANGRLRILDFGLAHVEGLAFAMSRTGEVIGTPLYMAPEQLQGERNIGPWSDVHAVGLILYELASGERISRTLGLVEELDRMSRSRPRLPRKCLKALPQGIASIISRAIEAHPEDRYRDCAALKQDLEQVAQGQPPVLGALSSGRRLRSAAVRHRWRIAAGSAAVFALIALAWYWPVPVVVRTQLSGKVITVDGKSRGISPARFSLWPGRHRLTAVFGDSLIDFSRELLVQPHVPLDLLYICNPRYNVPTDPFDADLEATHKWAWVEINTPLKTIGLKIDDKAPRVLPGIYAVELPFGRHDIEVGAPGHRPQMFTVDLQEQTMCTISAELDEVDSPWHTVLAYSPLEDQVQRKTLELQGLRLTYEQEAGADRDKVFVNRAYWSPSKPFETGHALFAMDLPVPLGDLDLEVEAASTVSRDGAWTTLEMGPGPDDLLWVARFPDKENPPSPLTTQGSKWRPTEDMRKALAKKLAGRRVVYVRVTAGGSPVGEDCGYACVLRSHGLPDHLIDGRLLWSPALRLRVRAP